MPIPENAGATGFRARPCFGHGAATALKVTRTTLSEPVNEKRGISPEMAVRLSKVFGGSAESWLVQQAQYDLAHVRAGRMKLKRLQLA